MAQRNTLNVVQIAVLRWISDGCRENGVDGISARISAGALRNRGLVRTMGRGPTWRATITADGKDYLQQREDCAYRVSIPDTLALYVAAV
jgi:hypothetical protein